MVYFNILHVFFFISQSKSKTRYLKHLQQKLFRIMKHYYFVNKNIIQSLILESIKLSSSTFREKKKSAFINSLM